MEANTKPTLSEPRSTISSIEARRILAVLDDCKSRIEYALLLPNIQEFMDKQKGIDDDVQAAYAEFLSHQHAISSMLTADGNVKQGRESNLSEETDLYKDCSRDLIRVMMKHSDLFISLLQQSANNGGSTGKLTSMMKELNEMMNLTFNTPVESEEKQARMMQEIQQRKKSNREYIDSLKTQDAAITRERDQKVRGKEDVLDEIKQQLNQARANENALIQDDNATEENQSQEESLKQQLTEAKAELAASQKTSAEQENKERRLLRKDEEAVQSLIEQYDKDMADLTKKIEVASVEAEKREKQLQELQEEYNKIDKERQPIGREEQNQTSKTNQNNKLSQEMIASAVKLQIEIRKYLKTAPKIVKKKSRKGKKGGKKGSKKSARQSVKQLDPPEGEKSQKDVADDAPKQD